MPDSQVSPDGQKTTVKCQDCGYLAWRNKHTRELAEAEAEYRKSPDMSITELDRNYQRLPLCFLAVHDIRGEIEVERGKSGTERVDDPATVLNVISKERTCSGYTEWKHGMSPKEHMQMHLLEEQRKREDKRDDAQREWQRMVENERRESDSKREDSRDKEQREWQKAQEQERREWESAQSRLALQTEEARHNRSIWWSVACVAIGVALGLPLQLLAELVKTKWISPAQPVIVQLLTSEDKRNSSDVKPMQ